MPNKLPYDTQKSYIVRALLDRQTLDYGFWTAHRIFCHHKRLEGIREAVFNSIKRDKEKYIAFADGLTGRGGKTAQPFFPIKNIGSSKGNPIKGNRCGVYRLATGWRGVLRKVAKEKGWLYA